MNQSESRPIELVCPAGSLPALKNAINRAAKAGVDAVILADPGLAQGAHVVKNTSVEIEVFGFGSL